MSQSASRGASQLRWASRRPRRVRASARVPPEPPLDPETILPPGDSWIVYPAENRLMHSSIRFEAMRDGIEDYELLQLLNKKNPRKAQALARRMIPKMSKPEKDVAKFRRARKELLEALSA